MTKEEKDRMIAQDMDTLVEQAVQRGGLIGLFDALDRWLIDRASETLSAATMSRYKALRILTQTLRRVLLEV
jgi:hypothetical protein